MENPKNKSSNKMTREERLAKSLRDNLRRRKQAARKAGEERQKPEKPITD